MATNYDIHFLRLLVQNGLADREGALRCLQTIQGEAQRGRTVNAAQVVLELQVLDRPKAERVHEMVNRIFQERGETLVAVDPVRAEQEVSGEHMAVPNPSSSSEGSAQIRFFELEGLPGYELGPLMGHGVAGSSYLGRTPERAPVVIKTLSRRFVDHPHILEQVLRELQAWAGMRHPNAAATIALGQAHNHHVVVFEHAPGKTLAAYLAERGSLTSDEALKILVDMCDLLRVAHGRGLYVGDIRSNKIYYDGDRARLTDLGLSRASCLAAGYGQYGLPFGHPAYLAPEVLQESQQAPTPASDIYALGILLYEMLCGQVPFQGEVAQVLEQHLEAAIPPPPEEVTFSTATAGVILRMTAKNLDMRVRDAGTLGGALLRLREGKPFRLLSLSGSGSGDRVDSASRHDWDEASTRAATRATGKRKWSETRIQKAPVIGPSDIGTTHSTLGGLPPGQVSGRLPPELVARLKSELAEEQQQTIEPGKVEARIGDKLGRGSVGTSYTGEVNGLEGPLVLKVVSRKYARHPEIQNMILEELKKPIGFKHPNVVPVLDVFNAGGRDVVAMERVEGQTLRKLLDTEGKRQLRESLALVTDVLNALEAAEERGFAHGDIRPEKIYVTGGIARLADFGHAKAACLGSGYGKHGLYFGDPVYLAPEVLQDRHPDPSIKADIYSLGITLYEMLCGKAPFKEADPKATLLAHLKQPLPPPPDDVALPQPVAEAILKMTAKDPSKRYGSVAAARDGLQSSMMELSAASGDLSAALMGGSDPGMNVEEFDPLASSGGAHQVWGLQSQVTGRKTERWTKEKLQQAQKVGPMSWSGPGVKPGEADGLYENLKKASGDKLPALTKAMAKAGKAAAKKKKKKKTKKGEKEVDQKQLMMAGGGLALLLIVVVILLIVGSGDDEKPETANPDAKTSGQMNPARKKEAEAEEAARQQKIDEALSTYRTKLENKLDDKKYQDALDLREQVFEPHMLGEKRVQEAVEELEGKVRNRVEQRMQKDTKAVRRLVKADRLRRALARAKDMRSYAIDKGTVDGLIKEVRGLRDAERKALTTIARHFNKRVDRKGLELKLNKRLEGWTSTMEVMDGGAVVLHYPKPDKALEADLRRIKGAKAAIKRAPGQNGRGLHLKAGKHVPSIVALRVPFRYVLEASIELVVEKKPQPNAEVALVAGMNSAAFRGKGVTFGLPASLNSNGVSREAGEKIEGLRLRKPVRMRFVAPFARRPNLVGNLIDPKTLEHTGGKTMRISRDDLDGLVGIYVLNTEVWILSLKVKGVVDAAELLK